MLEIIPSINHPDPAEIIRRIRAVEGQVPWVHVDVSDGIFSSQRIFNDPEALRGLVSPANIELHLMVHNPAEVLDQWLATPARRIILHVESTADFCGLWDRIERAGRETVLALLPATAPDAYVPHARFVPRVLVLAVTPGPSGQVMLPGILQKVRRLKELAPSCIIEVDGGVSMETGTAQAVVTAGATCLCAGGAVFASNNPQQAIAALKGLHV